MLGLHGTCLQDDHSKMPESAKPHVTLVRGPIVSSIRAMNNEATPCIAFAYLSAYLDKHGYVVDFVDAIGEGLNKVWPLTAHDGYQCQGLTFEEIIDRIPARTKVIGFSGMFSGEWPVLRDLINHVRVRFPKALIVIGGEHATALTEFSLRDCPAIDACVRGEGEHTFYELLEAHGESGSFNMVEGIAFLDEAGGYVENSGLQRIRDVNQIPWPKWPEGYLERFWEAGKSYGVESSGRDMPFMASRGCPYQCTFCSNPQMWTTRYILRDVDDVIAEIKSHIERYDITALQFYDLTAITKKRWTMEFCQKLIDEGIDLNWSLPSGTRSEALDAEILAMLKRTGCNYLVYAPESGSPETLTKIKKRIDLGDLTRSVIEANRQGIVVRTNLIIGFPHETRRQIFQTIRYGLYLAIRGAEEVTINIFSPYPGTQIFQELLSRERVQLNDSYFLALTSLNSEYTSLNPMTVSDHLGPRELGFYRITFMLSNYIVGYLSRPMRIINTLRVLLFNRRATTVLEHRLKDAMKRGRVAEL
jgi:anaerobic magnesium-protoporphyrin IX monomethyl ester cyclase